MTDMLAYLQFLAVATIFGALAMAACLLGEVLNGSGWDIESEYKGPAGLFREYSFQPSIESPALMFALLATIFSGIILGCAALYLWLSRTTPKSSSNLLDGVSAVYFSLVTFATVGYGDFYPANRVSRLIVSSEILISLFVLTIVLATAVSWIQSRRQDLLDARSEGRR